MLIVTHARQPIRQFARKLWALHEGHLDITDCAPVQVARVPVLRRIFEIPASADDFPVGG